MEVISVLASEVAWEAPEAFGSGFGNGGQSLRLVSSSLCIRSCLGLKPVRENVLFPLQHGSFVIGKRRRRLREFAAMIR
jgi:hypothetical protein